jgi:short-subunit dehydrogenase
VLVNNAGFGIHGQFIDTDLQSELRLVDLQVRATLALTKLLLPGLKREGGRILNVASVYSYASIPNQIVYAACKTFLLSFSRGLATELAGSGVTVTVLCPGVTQTQFRTRAGMREKKSFLSMTPEVVAEAGLRGLFRGRGVVVPGLVNKLYVTAAGLLPGSFFAQVARLINYFRGVGAKS